VSELAPASNSEYAPPDVQIAEALNRLINLAPGGECGRAHTFHPQDI
jgi:hypothetical protein